MLTARLNGSAFRLAISYLLQIIRETLRREHTVLGKHKPLRNFVFQRFETQSVFMRNRSGGGDFPRGKLALDRIEEWR